MNFKNSLKGMDDFDRISREIWADMRGEKIATNSIEPFFTNLWVDERKLFTLLASSTDFNTYLFDAKKNFINYAQEVEQVNLKEIPPAKIDNVKVKAKMIEKLIIQEPKLDEKQFQNSFLERLDQKVWVNVSPGYIDPRKYTHHTEIGISERKIECTINIPYRNYHREATKTVINETEATVHYSSESPDAIQIRLSDAEDYMAAITYLFPYHRQEAQVALISHFEEAGNGLTSIDDLMFFYNQLPNFALTGVDYKGKAKKLSDGMLWDHFLQFLNFDSQLIRDVDSIGKAAALAVEPFRDKSRYAIRILTAISGEFVYKKIKNDPKLILHIYHSLDGESVYMGKGIIADTTQAAYGQMYENKELFVIYVTAFMQAQHATDDAHQPLDRGSLFALGVSRDSDTIERHCELTGYFMEGDPNNIVTLINTVKVFNLKTKEIEAENEIENGEFRPLDMLHLKVYEKMKLRTGTVQTLETDTEVPALFLYHIAQKKAAEDALRCLRVAADLMVISASLATIESGVSGLPLYAAYADIGVALSDFYIETRLRDELKMTTRGKKLLKLWDDIYMVQGTASAMASMLTKAEKALDVTVEVLYTSRYPRQQESLQKLIKNALYSFPLRDYSKNGLRVLLKDGIKKVTEHSSDFEKLNVLFIENAQKEIAVLYKGKKFFQANSAGRTGKFLDYLYRKASGNITKLDEEISRLAGMAENVPPNFSMKAEEFEAGWKALQEAIVGGKITGENAIDYIYEVLPYFNHHVVNGEVVMISNTNCVNVVKNVIEYLTTGKLKTALPSEGQEVDLLEQIYNDKFKPTTLEALKAEEGMKEGEIGIIFAYKNISTTIKGHVFNIVKKNNRLILPDGQFGILARTRDYKYFEYIKVK
ncbi:MULTISPECIES: hypothetical protein [Chryseobacterium]|uniref:Uncharacterized protein n=1 Tax=Chryseobacterium camelliae TaxID=1265445 RepID=A0ABU0TLS3_9FLAO|nr:MULTISPECIES: hypothetical protein [Chryseobacterium]MDT3408205.1 hypothetical protein [Pseudacidovorax intermedius]MDQ1097941.1 hypothetical protein [Chryseobacterium camelliae]MDQ1101872.1 hypothetical protein [Chryseobacterium sp. SORGH_AS_1048]MDR6085312.1 hypothetical protein [Chryseobacterium sp. SORGH_AS_0909]MDR6129669.1 hypothetical protein [Chryseobacterium sp. SORGH_AS_1175]